VADVERLKGFGAAVIVTDGAAATGEAGATLTPIATLAATVSQANRRLALLARRSSCRPPNAPMSGTRPHPADRTLTPPR
jgi:hypothetical protein